MNNPITGTYTIDSSIIYRDFAYLKFRSNEYFITNDRFSTQVANIRLRNYPLNRGFKAIYTFQIANPNLANTDSLSIALPSELQAFGTSVVCNYQKTITQNYVSLLLAENTNQLACSLDCNLLTISGISTLFSAGSSDSFVFISLYGIKNPEESSNGRPFEINFFSENSVLSQFSKTIAYQTSETSLNFKITDLTLASSKQLVLNQYSVSIQAVRSSIDVSDSTKVAVIISLPREYNGIWTRVKAPASITMTTYSGSTPTSHTSLAGSVKIVTGKLIADFYITSKLNIEKATVQF
jgi:hypothetical protein